MNKILADLKAGFRELEKREQAALLGLSGFLFLVIFYIGVWLPIGNFVADSQLDHDKHRKLNEYLQSTVAVAKTASANGKSSPAGGQSLLTSISRTAQSVGIQPSRMQPEGSAAVSVWFDTVAFTKLMLWLKRLETQKGVVVRQITIDRRDDSGQVSARLVLKT